MALTFGRSRRVGGVPRGPLGPVRVQWILRPQSGDVRVPADDPCQIETAQALCAATLWNLSRTGAFLAIEPPIPEVGASLRITFSLATERAPIACDARVAWQNPASIIFRGLGALAAGLPTGCGIEFNEMRIEDRRRIEARIESNLG